MTHQKPNKTFLKTPISSAFLGHCVPLGSLSHTHEREYSPGHTLSLRVLTVAQPLPVRPFPTAHDVSAEAVVVEGLQCPRMALLSPLMLSFIDHMFQERGLYDPLSMIFKTTFTLWLFIPC